MIFQVIVRHLDMVDELIESSLIYWFVYFTRTTSRQKGLKSLHPKELHGPHGTLWHIFPRGGCWYHPIAWWIIASIGGRQWLYTIRQLGIENLLVHSIQLSMTQVPFWFNTKKWDLQETGSREACFIRERMGHQNCNLQTFRLFGVAAMRTDWRQKVLRRATVDCTGER